MRKRGGYDREPLDYDWGYTCTRIENGNEDKKRNGVGIDDIESNDVGDGSP
jgi:hypothetical protein